MSLSYSETILPHAQLLALLDYDPATGLFRRNGKLRGLVDKDGYTMVWLMGHRYRAGRLAWFYVHGTWPSSEIDHKNRVRSDDRICNLRDVDHATNASNKEVPRSGYLYYLKTRGKWAVWIKQKYVGTYSTVEEAQQARDQYLLSHGPTMGMETDDEYGKEFRHA